MSFNQVNGCAILDRGQEQYREFYSSIRRRNMVQYDYRADDGALFSTVKETVEKCREARDIWLNTREH